jgi:hypothetical protein
MYLTARNCEQDQWRKKLKIVAENNIAVIDDT